MPKFDDNAFWNDWLAAENVEWERKERRSIWREVDTAGRVGAVTQKATHPLRWRVMVHLPATHKRNRWGVHYA